MNVGGTGGGVIGDARLEPAIVLVVEDSPEDFETTRRAFARLRANVRLHWCGDGESALSYLQRRGGRSEVPAPLPTMILLDLNLPGTDGQSLVGRLRRDARLCTIPIIILTTSADPRDVQGCYAAGANGYVQKPVDFARFVDRIADLERFWLRAAVLPA